jgi:hypothetical protein
MKKAKKKIVARPAGVKIVAAPKSAKQRKWASDVDISVSGGCHSVNKGAVVHRV